MDVGNLCVNVLAGLVVLGWWLAAHPGLAVLAALVAVIAALAAIGMAASVPPSNTILKGHNSNACF